MAEKPADDEKQKRVAEIFGDEPTLPSLTSDERPEVFERDDSERQYLENRPPHHN